MQNPKPFALREDLWGIGAVLLVIGGIAIFGGLMNASSAYSELACGISCNPPVTYGHPDLLLANAYAFLAYGLLIAVVGVILLLVPRH